jgi:putative oxidoreductase
MNETLREWEPQIRSILRIVVALCYLQHGLAKLIGFPTPTPANMPAFYWFINIPLETVGSLLVLIGLWTRPVALLISGEMAVAFFIRHLPNGFAKAGIMGMFPSNPNNGGTLPILYSFLFLYIFFAGPGPWSIDAARGAEARRPATA